MKNHWLDKKKEQEEKNKQEAKDIWDEVWSWKARKLAITRYGKKNTIRKG